MASQNAPTDWRRLVLGAGEPFRPKHHFVLTGTDELPVITRSLSPSNVDAPPSARQLDPELDLLPERALLALCADVEHLCARGLALAGERHGLRQVERRVPSPVVRNLVTWTLVPAGTPGSSARCLRRGLRELGVEFDPVAVASVQGEDVRLAEVDPVQGERRRCAPRAAQTPTPRRGNGTWRPVNWSATWLTIRDTIGSRPSSPLTSESESWFSGVTVAVPTTDVIGATQTIAATSAPLGYRRRRRRRCCTRTRSSHRRSRRPSRQSSSSSSPSSPPRPSWSVFLRSSVRATAWSSSRSPPFHLR